MSEQNQPDSILQKASDKVLNRDVYYAGREIITQGDTGGVRAYYIESGRVDIIVAQGGHELKIAQLGPGDIFGEMALISNEPRSATARVAEDCTLAVITRGEIEKKMNKLEDPAIGSLIHTLVERLREANEGQIRHYRSFADFQDRLMGLIDRTQSGIDKQKRTQFRDEIEPLLEKLQDVLDRYAKG